MPSNILYNCRTNAEAPDWSQFVAIEIEQCRTMCRKCDAVITGDDEHATPMFGYGIMLYRFNESTGRWQFRTTARINEVIEHEWNDSDDLNVGHELGVALLKDWGCIQINPCADAETYTDAVEDGKVEAGDFWTVYGRKADGEAEAITDVATPEDAEAIRRLFASAIAEALTKK